MKDALNWPYHCIKRPNYFQLFPVLRISRLGLAIDQPHHSSGLHFLTTRKRWTLLMTLIVLLTIFFYQKNRTFLSEKMFQYMGGNSKES